ncbi:MAG: hypothetical protein P8N43_07215 [Alphaproteobacteria bacterium]|nr:hypothetical protein [Alphaproteobacteria bacterium]
MSIPQAPYNSLYVQVSNGFNDSVKVGAVDLYLDTSYRPDHHRVISATVASVPRRIDKRHHSIGGISPTVCVGELVYFHYGVITEENKLELEGEVYYRLDYDAVFCRVVDGQIVMVCSWVLAQPMYGDDVQEVELSDGVMGMARLTASGLVVDANPAPLQNRALLKHIGDNEFDLKGGEPLWIASSCNFENDIEGSVFWTFRQEDILAI